MPLIVFFLATGSFAFAQSPLAELEKIKQIKLLESTGDDVKRIFADDPFSTMFFISTENFLISIDYSIGNCSAEDEDWNVPEGKVKEIHIDPKIRLKPEELGIDLSKFVKEKRYTNNGKYFVYHNKLGGISYYVYKGEIERIIFIPPKENYPLLCKGERVRQYYSSKSWFAEKLKERRYYKGDILSIPVDVTDITLSQSEIIADCPAKDLIKTESCPDRSNRIFVETIIGQNYFNSVLTYLYLVTGGKIIGNGKQVLWDLSGVKPGTYKITAATDEGCGVCAKTMTKSVVVKECPDCSQK